MITNFTFFFFQFKVVVTIKHQFYPFLLLKISFRIVFAFKRWNFQLNVSHIFINPISISNFSICIPIFKLTLEA